MTMRSVARAAFVVAALAPSNLVNAQSPDTPEPGSVEAIAAATTEPRFLSPRVSYVPDHPNVPSPTRHLGHIVGAPGEPHAPARRLPAIPGSILAKPWVPAQRSIDNETPPS